MNLGLIQADGHALNNKKKHKTEKKRTGRKRSKRTRVEINRDDVSLSL